MFACSFRVDPLLWIGSRLNWRFRFWFNYQATVIQRTPPPSAGLEWLSNGLLVRLHCAQVMLAAIDQDATALSETLSELPTSGPWRPPTSATMDGLIGQVVDWSYGKDPPATPYMSRQDLIQAMSGVRGFSKSNLARKLSAGDIRAYRQQGENRRNTRIRWLSDDRMVQMSLICGALKFLGEDSAPPFQGFVPFHSPFVPPKT